MGEARRRSEELIDDAREFEIELSERTLTRLQIAIAKAGASDEAAHAAQAVALGYQQAMREALAAIAEAAGYEMPESYQLNLDTKRGVLKVMAQVPQEQSAEPPGTRVNGHVDA